MNTLSTLWVRIRDTWSARHEPENLRQLADTYWRMLLIGTVVLIILLALYGGYTFWATVSADEDGAVVLPQGGGAALNRAQVQIILDGFAARSERYDALKNNRPKIADPSK